MSDTANPRTYLSTQRDHRQVDADQTQGTKYGNVNEEYQFTHRKWRKRMPRDTVTTHYRVTFFHLNVRLGATKTAAAVQCLRVAVRDIVARESVSNTCRVRTVKKQ